MTVGTNGGAVLRQAFFVALQDLYLRAGRPSPAGLVSAARHSTPQVALTRDTVRAWTAGRAVPPLGSEAFEFVVAYLERSVPPSRRVREPYPLAWWRRLQEQAAHSPAPAEPALTRTPVLRPVAETDPFALGVHRPLDVVDTDTDIDPLPLYVERDHDRLLARTVEAATSGRSALVVLIGGPSTGKSRACWEAVRRLPERWNLWHPPAPGRAGEVLAGLETAPPYTVVWLDEAQHHLLKSSPERGERLAASLVRLLDDPFRAPVLVLGTMWPESWATATTAPPTGMIDDYPLTRKLLRHTGVHVPNAFNDTERAWLRDHAGRDVRLARAAARPRGEIAQYLSGVTAETAHHQAATPVQQALVDAAIDARRLGHCAFLAPALLAAATPGYLPPGTDLTDDWFEQALAYAVTVPADGRRAILRRVDREPAEDTPCYVLADHSLRTGATRRRYLGAPAPLWDALLEHGATDDITTVAQAAQRRGLYRHAFRLLVKAADNGNIFALGQAAALLSRGDGATDALPSLRADGAGDPYVPSDTGRAHERAGHIAHCVAAYERAARAGDHHALTAAAETLERSALAAETAETENPPAVPGIAMVEYATRTDAFADLYTGSRHVATRVERLREAAAHEYEGRIEDAIHAYRDAAERGDPVASGHAAALLRDENRLDEALTWLKERGCSGDRFALDRAVRLLRSAGRDGDTITRYGIEADARTATPWDIGAAPAASPRVLADLVEIERAFVEERRERESMTWTLTDEGLFTRSVGHRSAPNPAPAPEDATPGPRLTARLTQLESHAHTHEDIALDFDLHGDPAHPCRLYLVIVVPRTDAIVEPIAADHHLGDTPTRFVFNARRPGRHLLRITVYDKESGTALQVLEAGIDVAHQASNEGAACQ